MRADEVKALDRMVRKSGANRSEIMRQAIALVAAYPELLFRARAAGASAELAEQQAVVADVLSVRPPQDASRAQSGAR